MQAPFSGFVLPPAPHAVALVVAAAVIVALLYAIRPPVTQRTVLAFTPWMISGAALHVFYQVGEQFQRQLYPPVVEPLFSAPAVYLTTFVAMGAVWAATAIVGQRRSPGGERSDGTARYFGALSLGITIPLVGLLIWQGLDAETTAITLEPIIPVLGVLVTMAVTFVIYILLGTWRTYVIAEARLVGALVLFAHLLDGITTAIGVDILGTGERSVLPARIIDVAAGLPTAEYIGTGWLFVVVKMIVAVAIVVVFADYVSERPTRGNLCFAFIAAVGLGPAMNNLFLFLLGVGG
jgi:uncharacterized membrane protein